MLAFRARLPWLGAIGRILAHAALGFSLAGGAGPAGADGASKLAVYETGRAAAGLPCDTLPRRTAVLMGGGKDVDDAYAWMIDKMYQCDGSRLGNFVVIRAQGGADYGRLIYALGPVAAVQTLVIPDRAAADDPALDPYIRNAAALWITGGYQGSYYREWKGTRLERLVFEQVGKHGIPVGGTSAGMMILSEFNYLGDPHAVTSPEALADPYKTGYMTLTRDFWGSYGAAGIPSPFPGLSATITDSHLDSRQRMGRLVTFLARVITDGWVSKHDARAIGVDHETALLLEADAGDPSSFASQTIANPGVPGSAYILSADKDSLLSVVSGAFTFTNIRVRKLPVGSPVVEYQLRVENGVLESEGNGGSIY